MRSHTLVLLSTVLILAIFSAGMDSALNHLIYSSIGPAYDTVGSGRTLEPSLGFDYKLSLSDHHSSNSKLKQPDDLERRPASQADQSSETHSSIGSGAASGDDTRDTPKLHDGPKTSAQSFTQDLNIGSQNVGTDNLRTSSTTDEEDARAFDEAYVRRLLENQVPLPPLLRHHLLRYQGYPTDISQSTKHGLGAASMGRPPPTGSGAAYGQPHRVAVYKVDEQPHSSPASRKVLGEPRGLAVYNVNDQPNLLSVDEVQQLPHESKPLNTPETQKTLKNGSPPHVGIGDVVGDARSASSYTNFPNSVLSQTAMMNEGLRETGTRSGAEKAQAVPCSSAQPSFSKTRNAPSEDDSLQAGAIDRAAVTQTGPIPSTQSEVAAPQRAPPSDKFLEKVTPNLKAEAQKDSHFQSAKSAKYQWESQPLRQNDDSQQAAPDTARSVRYADPGIQAYFGNGRKKLKTPPAWRKKFTQSFHRTVSDKARLSTDQDRAHLKMDSHSDSKTQAYKAKMTMKEQMRLENKVTAPRHEEIAASAHSTSDQPRGLKPEIVDANRSETGEADKYTSAKTALSTEKTLGANPPTVVGVRHDEEAHEFHSRVLTEKVKALALQCIHKVEQVSELLGREAAPDQEPKVLATATSKKSSERNSDEHIPRRDDPMNKIARFSRRKKGREVNEEKAENREVSLPKVSDIAKQMEDKTAPVPHLEVASFEKEKEKMRASQSLIEPEDFSSMKSEANQRSGNSRSVETPRNNEREKTNLSKNGAALRESHPLQEDDKTVDMGETKQSHVPDENRGTQRDKGRRKKKSAQQKPSINEVMKNLPKESDIKDDKPQNLEPPFEPSIIDYSDRERLQKDTMMAYGKEHLGDPVQNGGQNTNDIEQNPQKSMPVNTTNRPKKKQSKGKNVQNHGSIKKAASSPVSEGEAVSKTIDEGATKPELDSANINTFPLIESNSASEQPYKPEISTEPQVTRPVEHEKKEMEMDNINDSNTKAPKDLQEFRDQQKDASEKQQKEWKIKLKLLENAFSSRRDTSMQKNQKDTSSKKGSFKMQEDGNLSVKRMTALFQAKPFKPHKLYGTWSKATLESWKRDGLDFEITSLLGQHMEVNNMETIEQLKDMQREVYLKLKVFWQTYQLPFTISLHWIEKQMVPKESKKRFNLLLHQIGEHSESLQ